MSTPHDDVTKQIFEAIEQLPEESLPKLLEIVRSYRENLPATELPTAAESFEAGWSDIKAGRVQPVDTLWDGITAH